MKRLKAMIASCLLSTLTAAPAMAQEQNQEETYQTASEDFDLPKWLVDFMIFQINDGGWDCQCSPASKTQPAAEQVFRTYNYKHGDSQSIFVKNYTNRPVKVVVSLLDPGFSVDHGKFEIEVPAQSNRRFSTNFAFSDTDKAYFIRTTVKVEIPKDAEKMSFLLPFVRIDRTDAHQRIDTVRTSGRIDCQTTNSCDLTGDSDTGKDGGPIYN